MTNTNTSYCSSTNSSSSSLEPVATLYLIIRTQYITDQSELILSPAGAALILETDSTLPDMGGAISTCGQDQLLVGVEPDTVHTSGVAMILQQTRATVHPCNQSDVNLTNQK